MELDLTVELGGEGEIRTLGTVSGTTVFKTVTFNHSVTSPRCHDYNLLHPYTKGDLGLYITVK